MFMRTPEEILSENCDSFGIGWSERRKQQTIRAIKAYANQKLDEAILIADSAGIHPDDVSNHIYKLK